MRCGRQGETDPAHYSGPRSHSLGKGRGQKADDDCVAALCRECHEILDSYENGSDRWLRSEEFLFYVVRTMNVLHRIGFKFKG
jgi:hypothetical protein